MFAYAAALQLLILEESKALQQMQGMLFFHFDSHKQDTYETWCRGQYESSSKWLMDSLFLLAGLIDFPLGFTSLSVAGQVVECLDLEHW